MPIAIGQRQIQKYRYRCIPCIFFGLISYVFLRIHKIKVSLILRQAAEAINALTREREGEGEEVEEDGVNFDSSTKVGGNKFT